MRLDLCDREGKYSNGAQPQRSRPTGFAVSQLRCQLVTCWILNIAPVIGRLLPLATAGMEAARRHLGAQPGQLHFVGLPRRSWQRQDGQYLLQPNLTTASSRCCLLWRCHKGVPFGRCSSNAEDVYFCTDAGADDAAARR